MSTTSYLRRCLSKWKYALIILLIISAMVAFFSIEINRWLPEDVLSFTRLIGQQFHAKISYRSAHYRFPDYVILKDVFVFDDNKIVLQSDRLIIGFLPLHAVVADHLTIHSPAFKKYLAKNGKKIYTWIKGFPKGKVRLSVLNGELQGIAKDPTGFTTDLLFEGEGLSAHGFFEHQGRCNYEINANIRDDGIDLDQFALKRGDTSIDLWGSWHLDSVNWKGFIFNDKFYILDIDGHLKIQKDLLVLDRLSFTVDGDAVDLSGECSRKTPFSCDAELGFWKAAAGSKSPGPLKSAHLRLHAQGSPQGPVFNGSSDLYFIFDPVSHKFQNVHLNFDALRPVLWNGDFMKFNIGQLQGAFHLEDQERLVTLGHVLASIDFSRPYQKIIALSAEIFAGRVYSRIFVNTSFLPWQIQARADFNKIDMGPLGYAGNASGTLNIQSSEETQLSGILRIRHGEIKNTRLMQWLSKILQMPSLESVSGINASCRFYLDKTSKMIDNVKLNADDLDLSGFFHLDADNLVAARASVRFSKKLLKESPVGRKIIGMVGGAWTWPFDFSLSGNICRMNFQWNKSTLKDRVRRHLFSFLAKAIDQRMNKLPYYNVTMPNESVCPG